jgi:hypothetical protein
MNLSVPQDKGEVRHRPDLERGLGAIAAGARASPIVWEMRPFGAPTRLSSVRSRPERRAEA